MEVIRALYVVRNPDKACVTVEVPLIDPAIGECNCVDHSRWGLAHGLLRACRGIETQEASGIVAEDVGLLLGVQEICR